MNVTIAELIAAYGFLVLRVVRTWITSPPNLILRLPYCKLLKVCSNMLNKKSDLCL